jgi:hypothetical protein
MSFGVYIIIFLRIFEKQVDIWRGSYYIGNSELPEKDHGAQTVASSQADWQ